MTKKGKHHKHKANYLSSTDHNTNNNPQETLNLKPTPEFTAPFLRAAIKAVQNHQGNRSLFSVLHSLFAKKNSISNKSKKLTFPVKKKNKKKLMVASLIKHRLRRVLAILKSLSTEDYNPADDGLGIRSSLFYSPSFDNINLLSKNLKKLINGGVKLEGLETRICAVLIKSEEEINYWPGEVESRSFFQCLKEFDPSDYEWRVLKAFKAIAAYDGVKLTNLLLEFINLASDSETLNKIRVLKSALKWVIEGEEDSVVIRRILAVLDWVDSGTKFVELIEEDITDKTILLFLNVILRMEFFWLHRGLPGKKSSRKSVYKAMEYELDKCISSGLKAIESDINGMKELSAFGFEGEHQNLKVKVLNIEGLWNNI